MENFMNIFWENHLMVIEKYEKTEKEIADLVENITKWIKETVYLPFDLFDGHIIERFLLRNKFSIDKTKQKIEMWYKTRSEYRYIFEASENILPSKEAVHIAPILKLNPNLERIIWVKVMDENILDLNRLTTFACICFEMSLRYDYTVGECYVIDFSNTTYKLPLKLDIASMFMGMRLQMAYSGRIRGINFINCPPHITLLMKFLKSIMPAKLFEKIQVHDNMESLSKIVPFSCMPKDYGGELESFSEMMNYVDKMFANLKETNFHHDLLKTIPDKLESVGSYKKLEFD